MPRSASRHAVPNALLPSVTLIFLQVGTMISGAITVETVYSWPGLGYLTFQALQIPDLPLLEGTFIIFSRLGDRVQPAGRPALPLPRPTGAADMTAASHASAVTAAPPAAAGTAPVRPRVRPPARAGWPGSAILVAVTAVALAAPLFIHPSDLSVINAPGPSLAPPSAQYPLGTDQAGRSVLTLLIWGDPALAGDRRHRDRADDDPRQRHRAARRALRRDLPSRVLMAITDWFIALPTLPLAIALAAVLGQGDASITIAIAVTSWPGTARLIRAQTLAVEARPFIERAKALGARDGQLMARQVLPNVAPFILVSATLTVASAILSETTLTFLGPGQPGRRVLGFHDQPGVLPGGDHQRRVVVHAPAWHRDSCRGPGIHPGRPRGGEHPQPADGGEDLMTATPLPGVLR